MTNEPTNGLFRATKASRISSTFGQRSQEFSYIAEKSAPISGFLSSTTETITSMQSEQELLIPRCRAQAIRYLLIDAGVSYTDNPISGRSKWVNELKPTAPFGQLPLLREGDLILAQSGAILRYLGRKHGRHPGDALKALRVDMINDHIEDLRKSYSDLIYKNYESGKEDFIKNLPQSLKFIENLLNKWGEKYILNEITFADYNCFDMLDILLILSPGCLDKFPVLKQYYDNIAAIPSLKAHRESDEFTKLPVNGNKNK